MSSSPESEGTPPLVRAPNHIPIIPGMTVVESIMHNFKMMEKESQRKQEEKHQEFKKQTVRLWSGEHKVDPDLERFNDPGQISLVIKSHFTGDSWLKAYKATIESHDGKKIGRFGYRVINLAEVERHLEYHDMHQIFHLSEHGGSELEELSQCIFDKQGNVRPAFYQGYRTPSMFGFDPPSPAIFGPELVQGKFALLCGEECDKYFQIEAAYRHRGAGTAALRELFKHKSLKDVGFIFAWPCVYDFPMEYRHRNLEEKALSGTVDFFRKVGFRRVGAGPIFAYALHDDNHPSRLLPMEEDMSLKHHADGNLIH